MKEKRKKKLIINNLFYTDSRKIFSGSAVILLIFIFTATIIPVQKAKAMDPVTIALLTPIAIKVAKTALPYVLAGLKELGVGLMEMGGEVLSILRLPLGFLEVTLGAPFGFFTHGIKDIIQGGIAPLKLVLTAITLPIRPFGAVF